MNRPLTKTIILALSILTLASCANNKVSLKQVHTYKQRPLQQDINQEFASSTITLVADNQKAMVLTEPVLEQSKTAEVAVNTAHRRPSLDEFSLDVLGEILKNADGLVIHGGDLLNNSCKNEFVESVSLINRYTKTWFLAPGNHDGFYLGISSPMHISRAFNPFRNGLLDERAGWALSCTHIIDKRKGGTTGFTNIRNYEKYEDLVVDKRTFNRMYLEEIGVINDGVTPERTPMSGQYQNYDLVCKSYQQSPHRSYLTEVCWTEYQNGRKQYQATNNFDFSGEHGLYQQWEEFTPWKNFVIQKLSVKLTSDKMIDVFVLDTSSYTNNRAVDEVGEYRFNSFGAADAGNLTTQQQAKLNTWLSTSKADEIILVGHHPLIDFDDASFSFITQAQQKYPISMYISGDTHDGYDVVQQYQGKDIIREVNLGSTIDAPIEYAKLGLTADNQTLVKRFSLTPINETRTNKKGLKKTLVLKGSEKNYVHFDNELWQSCKTDDWNTGYDRQAKIWDPLNTNIARRFTNFRPIERPEDWWGIHYVLNPFSIRDVRNKSLAAYKISRLVYLSEVYHNMMQYFTIAKSTSLQQKEREVEDSLTAIIGNEGWLYHDQSQDPFNQTLYNLDVLIQAYRAETKDNDALNSYKLCSALYDAEIEYRASFLEQLQD